MFKSNWGVLKKGRWSSSSLRFFDTVYVNTKTGQTKHIPVTNNIKKAGWEVQDFINRHYPESNESTIYEAHE